MRPSFSYKYPFNIPILKQPFLNVTKYENGLLSDEMYQH